MKISPRDVLICISGFDEASMANKADSLSACSGPHRLNKTMSSAVLTLWRGEGKCLNIVDGMGLL